jgi:hypothetical protein
VASVTADLTHAPRLTSLSPGAGCACKLPLAKLEQLMAALGDAPAMGPPATCSSARPKATTRPCCAWTTSARWC